MSKSTTHHIWHFHDKSWTCFLTPGRTEDRVHICSIFTSRHPAQHFAQSNTRKDGLSESMFTSTASLACKPQEERLDVFPSICLRGHLERCFALKGLNKCWFGWRETPDPQLFSWARPPPAPFSETSSAHGVPFSAKHSALLWSSCWVSGTFWYNALKHFLSQVFYTTKNIFLC